jgi:hypothetical protein
MKDPVRSVNEEMLFDLELLSDKIFPLPGATFDRRGESDPRLSKLTPMSGVSSEGKVTFYEHVATIRHKATNRYFVAFRQTMDALFLEQNDSQLYPEWLMKSDVKKTELKVYVYTVREHNGQPLLPSKMPIIRTHEDWLAHIGVPWVFDTLVFFLLKNHIITEEMYGKM